MVYSMFLFRGQIVCTWDMQDVCTYTCKRDTRDEAGVVVSQICAVSGGFLSDIMIVWRPVIKTQSSVSPRRRITHPQVIPVIIIERMIIEDLNLEILWYFLTNSTCLRILQATVNVLISVSYVKLNDTCERKFSSFPDLRSHQQSSVGAFNRIFNRISISYLVSCPQHSQSLGSHTINELTAASCRLYE